MGDLEKAVEKIKTMKIRGARKIAIVGVKAIEKIVKKNGFGREFRKACNQLIKARPTAVALYNAVEKIKKEKTMESIDNMNYYLENIGRMIGFINYNVIKNGNTILTHCHSEDVVEFLKTAKEKKMKFKVIVTETRPLYQGTITAKELSDSDIPVTYVIDSAAGYFVKDIDLMIFGCDAVRKEGIVNKIGTYPLAVVAKENKIPVYFVGGTIKFDKRKEIKIEERNPEEIIEKNKLKKCEIRNPVFDITPWKYVTAVISEKGVLKPKQILRLLK